MAHTRDKYCLVQISLFEIIKIHFFSIFIAIWFLIQRIFKMVWKGKKKPSETRDKPLSCLVDNTLGFHSYVKLQLIGSSSFVYLPMGRSYSKIPLFFPMQLSWFTHMILPLCHTLAEFLFLEPIPPRQQNVVSCALCADSNVQSSYCCLGEEGTKLHYVEVGNPNAPLALLLHGFPDCWLGWRHQMKSLSNHFRVVAFDLKGFGDSDKPIWRANYKIRTLIHEIYELVVSLQANKCTLIGHDIGAHIGWYFVTQHPEVVHKFVAISCPHPNVFWDYTTSTRFNSKWIKFCQVPLLPEMEAGGNDLSIIDEFYSHLSLQREENLIEAYKYAFSRPEDWTGPINYYRNLPFSRIREGREVIVPTLLIVGNRDPFIPLESIVKSAEYVSKCVLKIVKNGAHFPHQEYPDYVNNLLLQFLTVPKEKTESTNSTKGLMGSLYTNTMKYGNSLVDGVKKTTNGVVRLPSQMLKHSS